jgi:hypothetical protein
MIIDDLNVVSRAFLPRKTDPPLLVNAHTVLALPVAGQRFEPVPRYRRHVIQCCGSVKHPQLPPRYSRYVAEDTAVFAVEEPLGLVGYHGRR